MHAVPRSSRRSLFPESPDVADVSTLIPYPASPRHATHASVHINLYKTSILGDPNP
jgi:hypothetical protein